MLNEQNSTGSSKGPTIIVACAEQEQHEIGALIIALLLSINGWKVISLKTTSARDRSSNNNSFSLILIPLLRTKHTDIGYFVCH